MLNAAPIANHLHTFRASESVSITPEQARLMEAVIAAVEAVVALPAYRDTVLGWAPRWAGQDPGALGVFFGYDFHLGASGPQLIEINTNAGGVMLAGELTPSLEAQIIGMFGDEWRRGGSGRPLATVAIVDEDPPAQALFEEFVTFQELFRRHGVQTVIAPPEALSFRAGRLYHGSLPIDLVYNRLTDFTLECTGHAALRQAYLERASVVTPHPHAHALYGDKRNLIVLGDPERLHSLGAPADVVATLAATVPRCVAVTPENAELLWRQRRGLFFKPARGYGSKGVYRGDKLTRRVWLNLVQGDYVAQALIHPPRVVGLSGEFKFDLRHYVYQGRVLLRTARLYRGQATNLRTPGGGFAPVRVEG